MDWRFYDEGEFVEIDGRDDRPGFTEALRDSVGTRAPRGHPEGISTFWIDRLLDRLANWTTPGTELLSGNATYLERTETGIRAGSLYEMFDDERCPSTT